MNIRTTATRRVVCASRAERRPSALLSLMLILIFFPLTNAASGPLMNSMDTMTNNQTSLRDAVSIPPLIPLPLSGAMGEGAFTLTNPTPVTVADGSAEVRAIAQDLARRLNSATGFSLPIVDQSGGTGGISLALGGDTSLGEEGYTLAVTAAGVVLRAYRPAGLFRGVQTLRQLLPPAVEFSTVQPGPWTIPAVTIRDLPRFAWRGVMLDVARHFFSVTDVKRIIDELATYKINVLHLHLSDDQGWRIEIKTWPELTRRGSLGAVGGAPGGYYTQADYAEIVAYAQSRYMMLVPEIDMPGHTNAALASYPELNCSGVAPAPYTGTEVGFSTLCVASETTYRFIDDVVREIGALTPGPYFHIGGDESKSTTPQDYVTFVERVQSIVASHGKRMIGWEEISQTRLRPDSVAQLWANDMVRDAVRQGAKVVLSPANHAYLDMQYDPSTPLGLHWAGYVSVQDSYNWEPAGLVSGVGESDILGVEAPLWSETLLTRADIEYMMFPRLPGLAEIGWSPAEGRNWVEYRTRLGAHGPRLAAQGINFFAAPRIPWLQ